MIELLPEEHERVLPLVRASGMQGHLTFIYAVLEKRQPGRVFVDDAENPQTVLFCNLSGFYTAFGAPVEDIVWPQIAEIYARPLSQEFTELMASSPAWSELLARLLPDEPLSRLAFALKSAGEVLINWRQRVPHGFSVQPITEELAQSIVDGTGTGKYGVDPWFVRIAGGARAYAGQGLGQAVIDDADGQIASLCGFCALGNGEAEMEVGTPEKYRGRGLAVLASAAFMEQCHQQGWKPVYTCGSDNLASIGVAHKLGFVEIEEIQGYRLPSIVTVKPA